MIPLDQHFNDLLNGTVPFALPEACQAVPLKTVPAVKTVDPKLREPEALSTLTTCTMDCHYDTALTATPQGTTPDRKIPQGKVSRSKVEISAERSVPFEIDSRMMINRPRLPLKESGLPVSLNPAEPDPSIVGKSILGLKLPPSDESAPPAPSQDPKIRGEVSDEMIGLLEQQPAKSQRPSLKAFHPEDDIKQCEIEEAPAGQGLTEEERRWAEEAAEIEACELADEITEDDLAYEMQMRETQPTEAAFCPMLQVDRFAWPDFCRDMHPIIKTQLDHLGDQLIAKSASGKNVIAVVGSGPRTGSTSILLGLATAMETAGQRVAIVDANINSPTLANSLGLQPEQGWETVASGRLPVEESLIDSIEDHIALLPLCLGEAEKLTFGVRPSENERMNEAIGQMKEHYDLVLVDLGSPEAADIAAFSNMSEWIDSAVVVHNLRDGSRGQLIQAKNLMRDYGVPVAGIAENFAPREACFDDRHDYRAA